MRFSKPEPSVLSLWDLNHKAEALLPYHDAQTTL